MAPAWLPSALLVGVGAVAVVLAAVVVLTVTGVVGDRPEPQLASGDASGTASPAASGEPEAPTTARQPRTPGGGPGGPAAVSWARAVLGGWDRARERAWQEEDAGALRSLYVAGSSAGERDAELLARWVAAGVEVRALRLRLDDLRVVALSPRRTVLEVTDRLRVRAVTEPGEEPLRLGRDRPSTRVVELRRTPEGWRVARVVPAGSA